MQMALYLYHWACLGRAIKKSSPWKVKLGQTSVLSITVLEVWLLSKNSNNIRILPNLHLCLAGSIVKKKKILSVVHVKLCQHRLQTSQSGPLHQFFLTWQRRFSSTSLIRKVKHVSILRNFFSGLFNGIVKRRNANRERCHSLLI